MRKIYSNFFFGILSGKFKLFRIISILINDILILNITIFLSYFIRVEYLISFYDIKPLFIFANILYLTLFFILKIYQLYYRYFNTNILSTYIKLFLTYTIGFGIFVYFERKNIYIPRSITIIFPLIFFIILISSRKVFSEYFNFISKVNFQKIIIIGINSNMINSINNLRNISYIIENKKNYLGRIIYGAKVIDSNEFIKKIIKINFDRLLIFDEVLFSKFKFQIRETLINKNILINKIQLTDNRLKYEPYYDYYYLFNRKIQKNKIDHDYSNKVILITGAGGSIGHGLVNQLINLKFKKLILLDISEFNLYKLELYIKNFTEYKNISFYLKNFNDINFIKKIFDEEKIDIILHAAAYKHVPLIEKNQFAAIKNNFLDSHDFLTTCVNYNIPYVSVISSDKAVRPTNIMGASKRLTELSALHLGANFSNKTKINCVRFGNVINSSGSVLPLFEKQISSGGPVTLTSKKVIRYFMTIEQASNLVLSIHKISKGNEIFLLDMGNQISLFEIAKLMIQFDGKKLFKNGKGDVHIKIIGLRKGEKLYEELLVDNRSIKTKLNDIFQSIESYISKKDFELIYKNVKKAYQEDNITKLITTLKNPLINYSPND